MLRFADLLGTLQVKNVLPFPMQQPQRGRHECLLRLVAIDIPTCVCMVRRSAYALVVATAMNFLLRARMGFCTGLPSKAALFQILKCDHVCVCFPWALRVIGEQRAVLPSPSVLRSPPQRPIEDPCCFKAARGFAPDHQLALCQRWWPFVNTAKALFHCEIAAPTVSRCRRYFAKLFRSGPGADLATNLPMLHISAHP